MTSIVFGVFLLAQVTQYPSQVSLQLQKSISPQTAHPDTLARSYGILKTVETTPTSTLPVATSLDHQWSVPSAMPMVH